MRNNFNFLSNLFSRRDWFVGNPEDRFSRVVACVACSNISSATDNNIKNKYNEEAGYQIY